MHFEEYNEGINRWFDVYATPLKRNNFAAVFTDITGRKNAEMKARKILENINENYSEFDNEWHFVDINSKMIEEFGLKRDDIIGKVVWDLFLKQLTVNNIKNSIG